MTRSLMPLKMLNEVYGYRLAPNDRLRELRSYRLAPNDRLLDANGSAQRVLQLWTGTK